jgi:hypothetical protein
MFLAPFCFARRDLRNSLSPQRRGWLPVFGQDLADEARLKTID